VLPDMKLDIPIRAKVRTGVKTASGNPKATNCFHSTDAEFTSVLGTPEELEVTIPQPNVSDAFRTSLECWGNNATLLCWCNDAETAHRLNKANGYGKYKAGQCKPIGRLRFKIVGFEGIWSFEPKGWFAVRSIAGALAAEEPIDSNLLWSLSLTEKRNAKGRFFVPQLTTTYERQA